MEFIASVFNLIGVVWAKIPTWGQYAAGILAISGVVFGAYKLVRSVLRKASDWIERLCLWILKKFYGRGPTVPGETLRIVDLESHTWEEGAGNGETVLTLSTEWRVTNVHSRGVYVEKVYLKKPYSRAKFVYFNGQEKMNHLSSGSTYTIVANFLLKRSQCRLRRGKLVKTKIIFCDQFDNKHTRKVTCKEKRS